LPKIKNASQEQAGKKTATQKNHQGVIKMKRFLTLALAVASVSFIAAGTASAVDSYVAGDAAAGIGNSRHNLGSLGEHIVTTGVTQNGQVEILQGIRSGATVAVDGAGFLTDRAAVSVKEANGNKGAQQ